MDANIQAVLNECTRASDEARIAFPEVVKQLVEVGVERYHADLIRAEKTYYLASDETHVVPSALVKDHPARVFSAEGVERAVRASQAGPITYAEFCARVVAAGCVGYFVSMAGRRAVYFGRTGESHVEHFPAGR